MASVEKIKKQAVFSGWILGGALGPTSIKGPFTVEVLPNKENKSYVAELLPTRQRFGGISHKKIEEVEKRVSGMFETVVKQWEVV